MVRAYDLGVSSELRRLSELGGLFELGQCLELDGSSKLGGLFE